MAISRHLPNGLQAFVDEEDSDLLERARFSRLRKGGVYLAVSHRKRGFFIHRLIAERKLGRSLTSKEHVDHIDGNTMNNTRVNLRLSTSSQNQCNRGKSKRNTTGYKGVTYRNRKWIAQIGLNGKVYYLGVFDSPEEAHEAYKKAAMELHGTFAKFE